MKWKLLLLIFICFKSFSQEKDLNYFITKAQNNSPLIKDYSNQIKSATLDSLLNRAVYKPQVTGNINANYAPIINGFGYDTALSNGQSVSGLVGVNQKIIGKNRINSQSDSFQLIKEGLVLNQKITLKDLNKTIVAQYISASASSEQISFNQKIATVLKQEKSIYIGFYMIISALISTLLKLSINRMNSTESNLSLISSKTIFLKFRKTYICPLFF